MSSKLSSVVRGKLAKLLPMLSSDRDGERIGAVAAIGRVLKSEKLDWHDLAAHVKAKPVQEQPQPKPQPQPQKGGWSEMDSDDLVGLIEEIRASGVAFNARAEGFLNSLLGRARDYEEVFLSEKQRRWLVSLAAKAGVELPS
jgi:hypothetical protein